MKEHMPQFTKRPIFTDLWIENVRDLGRARHRFHQRLFRWLAPLAVLLVVLYFLWLYNCTR